MSDDELQMKFFEMVQGTEAGIAIKELDSVWNLNNDPMAIRRAGLQLGRLSFVLGYRFAESQKSRGDSETLDTERKIVSYMRVLPRDAFNEGNLLKCIGRLTMLIEDRLAPGWTYEYDDGPFEIEQAQDDGSISVLNIRFTFEGDSVRIYRPVNSRECWPIYAEPDGEAENLDCFRVFTEHGDLAAVGGAS